MKNEEVRRFVLISSSAIFDSFARKKIVVDLERLTVAQSLVSIEISNQKFTSGNFKDIH